MVSGPVDVLAAGARVAPPPVGDAPRVSWRLSVTLGGVIDAEDREQAHEVAHAALEALAQTLPGFLDLESAVSVSALPRG